MSSKTYVHVCELSNLLREVGQLVATQVEQPQLPTVHAMITTVGKTQRLNL